MLTLPILMNHEHDKIVGLMRVDESGVIAEFHEAVTREQFFAIFGNVGCMLIEGEASTSIGGSVDPADIRIKRARILEWSSGITAAYQNRADCSHGIGPDALSDEIGIRGTFVCPHCRQTVSHPEPRESLPCQKRADGHHDFRHEVCDCGASRGDTLRAVPAVR